jgi:hypothetical protein
MSATMTVGPGVGVGLGSGSRWTDWVEFSATTIPTVPVYAAFGVAGIEPRPVDNLGVGVGSETIWRSPKSFQRVLLDVNHMKGRDRDGHKQGQQSAQNEDMDQNFP